MTEKRAAILKRAVGHQLGLVACPYIQGFERVAWEKNAAFLVAAGFLKPYVHGGFEITEAGRARATSEAV